MSETPFPWLNGMVKVNRRGSKIEVGLTGQIILKALNKHSLVCNGFSVLVFI